MVAFMLTKSLMKRKKLIDSMQQNKLYFEKKLKSINNLQAAEMRLFYIREYSYENIKMSFRQILTTAALNGQILVFL